MEQQIQALARLAREQQHGELVRTLRRVVLEPQVGQADEHGAGSES